MNDSNKEQLTINSRRTPSVEFVQATQSGYTGKPLHPVTPVARRKLWRVASVIALGVFGVIPVIGFLLQSEAVARFEGVGAAFCAMAFGWFLIRHLVRVMMKEEAQQEESENEQLQKAHSTVLPPEQNSIEPQMNLTKQPPDAG